MFACSEARPELQNVYDCRKLNSVTKTDTFAIPRIDDCIDKVGKAKYVTRIDLLKGQLDLKKLVSKSVEAIRYYVRPTKQREAACVTIDSYIQAGIFCDVLFCAGQRKVY